MLYTEAVDRLQALGAELHTSPGQPRRKFELAQMRTLMAALGDPQQSFPSVLIAGTNGKGSTAATLASILAASGLRTGLYTSPHLVRVNERIQILTPAVGPAHELPGFRIEDTLIPDEDFSRHLEAVIHAAERLVSEGRLPGPPSFFETVTAMAFLHFAEAPVDIAVLEVGLGGRLDATNIVQPVLSIITDISLDHTEWLGHTIAEIAREKAGILRLNGLLITLPQHPEANQAIGEAAVALNVRAINATTALPFDTHAVTNTRNRYPLDIDDLHIEVDSPLAGQHQQRNLALAITAALELRNILGPAESAPHPSHQTLRHPERSEGPAVPQGSATKSDASDQSKQTPPHAPPASPPGVTEPRVPHPTQSVGWANPVVAKRSSTLSSSGPEQSRQNSSSRPEQSPQDASSRPEQSPQDPSSRPEQSPQDASSRPEQSPQHPSSRPERSEVEGSAVSAPPPPPHQACPPERSAAGAEPKDLLPAGSASTPSVPASPDSTYDSDNITAASIAAGIRQTRWPARLERLTRGNQHILLDVGHNPAGAWTLRAALSAEAHPPRVILFGCLDDKPVEELAQILFPLFDRVLLVPVPSPRAASAARLLAAAQSVTAAATIQPDLITALATLGSHDDAEQDAVITGSVYLVGEARALLMAEGWASDAG